MKERVQFQGKKRGENIAECACLCVGVRKAKLPSASAFRYYPRAVRRGDEEEIVVGRIVNNVKIRMRTRSAFILNSK